MPANAMAFSRFGKQLTISTVLLAGLCISGPALAAEEGVTILRGSSAPPPVVQQTVVHERTIVEYRYVPYETPVYVLAFPLLAAPRIVRHHHK